MELKNCGKINIHDTKVPYPADDKMNETNFACANFKLDENADQLVQKQALWACPVVCVFSLFLIVTSLKRILNPTPKNHLKLLME